MHKVPSLRNRIKEIGPMAEESRHAIGKAAVRLLEVFVDMASPHAEPSSRQLNELKPIYDTQDVTRALNAWIELEPTEVLFAGLLVTAVERGEISNEAAFDFAQRKIEKTDYTS